MYLFIISSMCFIGFGKDVPAEEVTWVEASDALYFRGNELTLPSSEPVEENPAGKITEETIPASEKTAPSDEQPLPVKEPSSGKDASGHDAPGKDVPEI